MYRPTQLSILSWLRHLCLLVIGVRGRFLRLDGTARSKASVRREKATLCGHFVQSDQFATRCGGDGRISAPHLTLCRAAFLLPLHTGVSEQDYFGRDQTAVRQCQPVL